MIEEFKGMDHPDNIEKTKAGLNYALIIKYSEDQEFREALADLEAFEEALKYLADK